MFIENFMESLNLLNILLFFIIAIVIWTLAGIKWKNIQDFFHKRYSFVDLTFILIYFVEQIVLAYLIYSKYDPQIVAGIFSIIIITTASIQNKCWESRAQKINAISIDQNIIIKNVQSDNNTILQENKTLREKLKIAREFIEEIYKELKELKDIFDKDVKKLKKKR
jgi:hypothetical protein